MPTLCDIINKAFSDGKFPDCLSVGSVLLLHKSDDTASPFNYRPISILPTISKVFERSLFNRLIFLSKHAIISDYQFGFRRNRSEQDVVLKLLEYVHDAIFMKHFPLSVLIDFSEVFDT